MNNFSSPPKTIPICLTGVISLLIITICVSQKLYAISTIEPLRPGVIASATPPNKHSLSLSLLTADKYLEIPFHIFYGITDDIELETRWGFIYNSSSEAGMSDMKFSLKYNLTYFDADSLVAENKNERSTGITTEFGITLPTADHTRGLGDGGVGLTLGWNIRQNFEKNILGYLGLNIYLNNHELVDEILRNSVRVFSYTTGAKYFYNNDIALTAELKGFNNYYSKNFSVGASDFIQELYLATGILYKGDKPPITSASLLIGLTPDTRKKVILYLEKKFGH